MLSMEDFRVNGEVDWEAYRQQQVDVGEKCHRCGAFASVLNPPGHRQLCSECKDFDTNTNEVTSGSRLRCPKCRSRWSIDDAYELYTDGEHEVDCPECGHEFTISTCITVDFTSPKLLPEEDNSDEEVN